MKKGVVGAEHRFMFDPFIDPFDMLGLERRYDLDPTLLETHYFAAQRKTHPDLLGACSEAQKAVAHQKSSVINQAYVTLKDPLGRAGVLLAAAGIAPLTHDAETLERAMTWNEQRAMGIDITEELVQTEQQLYKDLDRAFTAKDYEKARIALYKLTYVRKILQTLKED